MTPPQKVGGLRVSSDYSEKKSSEGQEERDQAGEAVFFIRTGRPFKIKRGTERKKNSTSLLPTIDIFKSIPPL